VASWGHHNLLGWHRHLHLSQRMPLLLDIGEIIIHATGPIVLQLPTVSALSSFYS
jgi:hypothetical protein